MKAKFFYCMFLLMGMAFVACSDGEDGAPGEQGPPGETGMDGSKIYAGNDVPDPNIGVQGDFYLNKTTMELYGPKIDDTTWGSPVVLSGEDGENGEDGTPGEQGEQGVQGEVGEAGSKIYAGNGVPESSIGVEGDFYFDKTAQALYGPKIDDITWGMPIVLAGQDGADGEDGNANVMYSDWFYPDWNMSDLPTLKRMEVEDSNFSDTWLDGGATLVYWRTNNGSTFLLPWNSYNAVGELQIRRMVNYRNSTSIWIEMRKYTGDFTDDETEGEVGGIIRNRIRYVIIPGNVDLSAKSTLDYSDYEAVKAYYSIPD